MIKEKSKCISNCEDDQEYKFRYNGECFKQCPNNTNDDDNDFVCQDNDINKCYSTSNDFFSINESITFQDIEKLVQKYVYEFNYTDSHVSLYTKDDYTITIYINSKCIFELGLGIPEIDFCDCYEKVKNEIHLIDKELIIAIIDKKNSNTNKRKVIKYGMFSPITGKYIETADETCEEDKITFTESIEGSLLDANMDIAALRELLNEGIDVFDLSSPFYNDVCFRYKSKKDIALKDRILEYFPNITLCEEG